MKKLTKILAALVLAASSLVMSGCADDEITEILAGPTNTWCRMPVSYKDENNSQESNIKVYFYYSTTGNTIGKCPMKKGLNILIANENNEGTLFSSLTSGSYIVYSFDEDGNSDDGEKMINPRAKWSAIYWAKDELRQNHTYPNFINTKEPLSKEGIQNFSLKRLLAEYLLQILEG